MDEGDKKIGVGTAKIQHHKFKLDAPFLKKFEKFLIFIWVVQF